MSDNDIRRFRIDLDDLRERLARTRWTSNRLPGWACGVPLPDLQEPACHWMTDYD